MLTFQHGGKTYRLTFERKHKEVELVRKSKVLQSGKTEYRAKVKKVKSKFPYTTAKLIEMPITGIPTAPYIFAKATVGCYVHDPYTNSGGRLHALQTLSRHLRDRAIASNERIPKELIAAMWETYLNRNDRPLSAVEILETLRTELDTLPGSDDLRKGANYALTNAISRVKHASGTTRSKEAAPAQEAKAS